MKKKTFYSFAAVILIYVFFAGCGSERKTQGVGYEEPSQLKIDDDTKIGSVAEIFAAEYVPVEGYAIVGGLNHTGSDQCPPKVYEYLEKYIRKQLPSEKNISKYILSDKTAVVFLQALMPATLSDNEDFDVYVTALPATQTTSLKGGVLWGAELWEAGKFGTSLKKMADAEGAVYIDQIKPTEDVRSGYILGGGVSATDFEMSMFIRGANYRQTAIIRNRINQRFGKDTAKAQMAGQMSLTAPAEYTKQKKRFIDVVRNMYVLEESLSRNQRIRDLAIKLAGSDDKESAEYGLEAIGKHSISKLTALIKHSDDRVKFHAARCLMNLGNDEGLDVLRNFALDKKSKYRAEALDAIFKAGKRNDAARLARKLLRQQNDSDLIIKAYLKLKEIMDLSIERSPVANSFDLDQVIQADKAIIYAARSGKPCIALLGGPLRCKEDVFIQSSDGNITINAISGEDYVSIIRKHPTRPNLAPISLKSTREIKDIILTLCQNPLDSKHRGLNVSYSEAIALLSQLVEKNGVEAEFLAGPMPKISQIIKK